MDRVLREPGRGVCYIWDSICKCLCFIYFLNPFGFNLQNQFVSFQLSITPTCFCWVKSELLRKFFDVQHTIYIYIYLLLPYQLVSLHVKWAGKQLHHKYTVKNRGSGEVRVSQMYHNGTQMHTLWSTIKVQSSFWHLKVKTSANSAWTKC